MRLKQSERISTAAIIHRQGTFFVALRKPGTSIGERWEFPGGKVEPGEEPREGLVREFNEEFSVPIKVGREIGRSAFENRGRQYRLIAYEVELLSEEFVHPEHQMIKWATIEQLQELPLADSDRSLLPYIKSMVENR